MAEKRTFQIMTVLTLIIIILSSSISLLSAREHPLKIRTAHYISIEVDSVDLSSGLISFSMYASLQSSNNTSESPASMTSPYSHFAPQDFAGFYCQNGLLWADGNFTFSVEAHRNLYPFDFYRVVLLVYFPSNISSEFDTPWIRVPSDVSDYLCNRNLETSTEYNRILSGTLITIAFEICRPILYQVLVMMPSWFIFGAVFVLSSLEAGKAEEFKIKVSIYAALLIFTIGFSIAGAPTVSIISELLRASLLSILAMFIIADILIFKKMPITLPKWLAKHKEYTSAQSFPFVLAMLLLVVLNLQSAQSYLTGNIFALGPVYLFSASVPLVAMYVWLYITRKKWLVSAIMCLAVQCIHLFVVYLGFLR